MSTELTRFITPDALLTNWQGHRRLTRRVIDAFPDDRHDAIGELHRFVSGHRIQVIPTSLSG